MCVRVIGFRKTQWRSFGAWQPARLGSKTRPRGKRTQPGRRLFVPGQDGRAEDEDILVNTWSGPLLAAAMMGFVSLPAAADDVVVARVNGNDIKQSDFDFSATKVGCARSTRHAR